MAIQLKNTNDVKRDGVKILVYGSAGSGKTRLIKTLPNPVIFDIEGGLRSISEAELPYERLYTVNDIMDAMEWMESSAEAQQFDSFVFDSVSEIAELILMDELSQLTKAGNKANGQAAYGNMQSEMYKILRRIRDLPGKNVYCTAKLERDQDEMGRMLYGPSMPGKRATIDLPYVLEMVFALRTSTNAEGVVQSSLLTRTDGLWQAKQRTDGPKLEMFEYPDLGIIIDKLTG